MDDNSRMYLLSSADSWEQHGHVSRCTYYLPSIVADMRRSGKFQLPQSDGTKFHNDGSMDIRHKVYGNESSQGM